MEQKPSFMRSLYLNIKEIVVILLIVFVIRTFVFGLYQVPTGSMETTMLVGERFFADKLTPYFSAPKRGEIIALNAPDFNYSDNTLIRLYQEYVGIPGGPANWTKRVIGVPGDFVQGKIEDGKSVIYINGKKFDEPYLNKYPLIVLWKKDARIPLSWEEFGRDTMNQLEAPRSYDPTVSFEKQPFYAMSANRVFKVPPTITFPGTMVTPDGILLREPGTADMPSTRVALSGDDYLTNGDEFSVHLKGDEYWLMGDNRRGSHDSRFFGIVNKRLIHGRIIFRLWSMDTSDSWLLFDLIKHPIDFWKKVRWNRIFQRIS